MMLETMPFMAADKGGSLASGVGRRTDNSPATPSETSLVTLDSALVRLSAIIPENSQSALRKQLGEDEYNAQVLQVAITVAAFESGEASIPSAGDYLDPRVHASSNRTRDLGMHHLQGVIAKVVGFRERMQKEEIMIYGVQRKTAQQIRTLATYLGPTANDQLHEMINDLDAVERRILLDSLSTHQKCLMEYPDIDDCSAEQMGRYAHDAVFGKHGLTDDDEGGLKPSFSRLDLFDRIELIIEACSSRSGNGFDTGLVIDALLRPPYRGATINRMIDVASFIEQLDTLESILLEHPDTRSYAQRCRQILNGERKVRVPEWMNEAGVPSPRRIKE